MPGSRPPGAFLTQCHHAPSLGSDMDAIHLHPGLLLITIRPHSPTLRRHIDRVSGHEPTNPLRLYTFIGALG